MQDPFVKNTRHYRYYDFLMAAFVTVVLCSNLIGPGKSSSIGSLTFGTGNLFFPFSYIFGDVLTEVYGYARSRKVIWAGFAALTFASLMGQVVIHMPPNPAEPYNKVVQPALEVLFGGTWRLLLASLPAFWIADFTKSYVMAKMKLLTRGKHLWSRTIGSTLVAQGVDSLIFYPLAFFGIWKTGELFKIILFNWIFKVAIEVVLTPLTYLVVNWLKRVEQEDYFDERTNFSPFSIAD
jgi:uncharacterized integral membrane protein (TIGR00697 family)